MFITATTDILFRIHDSLLENKEVFNRRDVLPDTKIDKQVCAEFQRKEANRIVMRTTVIKKALDTLNEIDAICVYSNECLLEVSHTYGCQPKHIVLEDRVNGTIRILDVLRNIPSVPKKAQTDV